MTFKELGLSDALLAGLDAVGYESPSPIQAATIPPLLVQRKASMPNAELPFPTTTDPSAETPKALPPTPPPASSPRTTMPVPLVQRNGSAPPNNKELLYPAMTEPSADTPAA